MNSYKGNFVYKNLTRCNEKIVGENFIQAKYHSLRIICELERVKRLTGPIKTLLTNPRDAGDARRREANHSRDIGDSAICQTRVHIYSDREVGATTDGCSACSVVVIRNAFPTL